MTQFTELINSNYTTQTYTSVNGVYGRKFTSISNGNSIFLPLGGYMIGDGVTRDGVMGYYWTRSLIWSNSSNPNQARNVRPDDSGTYNGSPFQRNAGHSIRPVRNQ